MFILLINDIPTSAHPSEDLAWEEAGKHIPQRFLKENGFDPALAPILAKSGKNFGITDEFKIVSIPFIEKKENVIQTMAEYVKKNVDQTKLEDKISELYFETCVSETPLHRLLKILLTLMDNDEVAVWRFLRK